MTAAVLEGFYVTVTDGRRRGLLAGPVFSQAAAERLIPAAARVAMRHDDRAAFYAYGTCRIVTKPGGELPTGKLNHKVEGMPSTLQKEG